MYEKDRDARWDLVRTGVREKLIRRFEDIPKFIPATLIRKAIGLNYYAWKRLEADPLLLTIDQVHRLATVVGLPVQEVRDACYGGRSSGKALTKKK